MKNGHHLKVIGLLKTFFHFQLQRTVVLQLTCQNSVSIVTNLTLSHFTVIQKHDGEISKFFRGKNVLTSKTFLHHVVYKGNQIRLKKETDEVIKLLFFVTAVINCLNVVLLNISSINQFLNNYCGRMMFFRFFPFFKNQNKHRNLVVQKQEPYTVSYGPRIDQSEQNHPAI